MFPLFRKVIFSLSLGELLLCDFLKSSIQAIFSCLPYFRSINSCKNSKCLRNKVLKTLGYVRIFTYLSATNKKTNKISDMTKVAIKNENITSFGGIYIISLWLFILPHWFGWGNSCLCKNQESPKIPISMDKSQKCHFNI